MKASGPVTIGQMQEMLEDLNGAARHWDDLGWPRPKIMVVSGSGLAVDLESSSDYSSPLSEWLPFPIHQVEGHPLETELLAADTGCPVFYHKGRLHFYQGYTAHQTVFAVRLGALLGARVLIMTNAAGGLNPQQQPGDLVLIRDHINLIGMNPLRGELPSQWGPRFPDMLGAYDHELRRLAVAIGKDLNIDLAEGVYAGVAGPSYETPAEVRMLQTIGADLVGMSTVLEVIAARQMGIRCLCVSLVANLGIGVVEEPLDHKEVLEMSLASSDRVERLLSSLLSDDRLKEFAK